MRQQDSRIFAELLNRVLEDHHSQDDLDLLRTRTTSPNAPDYPSSVQHLFRTNAQVEMHTLPIFSSQHNRNTSFIQLTLFLAVCLMIWLPAY